ncbi:RHS repeat-associated core domain-containing protein [bacterium]|nr:RHS repeat-associated core domain-containing protein [bacterium]
MKTYDGGTLSGTTITGTPVAEQDWGLDALGNWGTYTQKASGSATLNQTRTHNKANEISAISIASGGTGTDWIDPTYDLAGNRVTGPYPLSPSLSLTMTYDAWNRLVRVQLNGTFQIFAAEYDGLGRRIVRTDEGMTRRSYYNESWQELEVRKEASAGVEDTDPMEQFVWHPYYIDALATRFYDANVSGSQTQHYFTHDANFNVTAALDTTGNVVERYDYSPYGEPIFLDANFDFDADSASDIAPYRMYTGQRLDTETGLYQYRNRYYHARLGRFISRDPIGYEGSDTKNLYEYVDSKPLDSLDPTGNDVLGDIVTGGGAAILTDICTPEPTDLLPHKWGAYAVGAVVIGGTYVGYQAYCYCRSKKSNDDDEVKGGEKGDRRRGGYFKR